jgi:hypothetical protein
MPFTIKFGSGMGHVLVIGALLKRTLVKLNDLCEENLSHKGIASKFSMKLLVGKKILSIGKFFESKKRTTSAMVWFFFITH